MTNTEAPTTCSPKARRLADQSDVSQAVADAYRVLAEVIRTDPRLARLVEGEVVRAEEQANEYDDDADDLREQALLAGFDPERDL